MSENTCSPFGIPKKKKKQKRKKTLEIFTHRVTCTTPIRNHTRRHIDRLSNSIARVYYVYDKKRGYNEFFGNYKTYATYEKSRDVKVREKAREHERTNQIFLPIKLCGEMGKKKSKF